MLELVPLGEGGLVTSARILMVVVNDSLLQKAVLFVEYVEDHILNKTTSVPRWCPECVFLWCGGFACTVAVLVPRICLVVVVLHARVELGL
jgi:hypothetical protein